MRNKVLSLAAGIAAVVASALFYGSFTKWIPALYILSVALYAAAAGCLSARFSKNKPLLRGTITAAVFAAVFFAATFLINNLIFREARASLAGAIICLLTLLFFIVFYCMLSRKKTKNRLLAAISFLLSLVLTVWAMAPVQLSYYYRSDFNKTAAPANVAAHTEKAPVLTENADLCVSPDGSDENDGSIAHPLASVEKARDLIREMDKTGKKGVTVALKAGEYSVKHIAFSKEDSGTENCPVTYCAYGDGDVILNGGVTLSPAGFSAVTDPAVLDRLSDAAKKNVVCTDLTKLGLTADDWGKLYSVGGYSTASNYDGDTTGPVPCVLYFNGAPMTTARYPDSGTLKVISVVREGEGLESSTSNHSQREDWATLRNPETTVFTVDKKTADRVHGYASLENVWLWTALMYNWADGTSPLKSFDYEAKTMEPAYVSKFGAVPGADYYIFNVIEELDSPGEWYLDRETGMLYLYPDGNMSDAQISLSLSSEDLITVTDAGHLRFEGLTVRGTRGGGFAVTGNDVIISGCKITDLSGVGVSLNGYDNALLESELSHIGASGAVITGGERESLTPGNSRVENCLFHDYSEVALTAGGGVNLNGVGNVCSHNEFYNSPQQAIFYGGNDMLIEYNLMHDVALLSDDCSAVYSGRRWDCGGSIVRYNVMYNLGDKDHHPNGIYWDDGMSGQTAYGNLILNCKQNGFLIGGGRDNNVYNNVLINCETPVSYDDRARDGALNEDSWFKHSKEGADMQQHLEEMPWQGEMWRKAYPYSANWSLDYSDTESPDFVPNPANSKVSGNLIVHYRETFGRADESVERFSDISGNAIYKPGEMKKLFTDPKNGDYTLRDDAPVYDVIPDFAPLPLDQVGRS
ncbi:MAG: right-handed parallel beta-helix repeat-containing protein [Clostridia bacterium]|nr:right-handed parallel beta-helix repeat-containing protein [Clostridia bacterium]